MDKPEAVDPFQTAEVAMLVGDLVRHVATSDADIAVKIAALRAAADLLAQAASAAHLAAIIRQSLTPKP